MHTEAISDKYKRNQHASIWVWMCIVHAIHSLNHIDTFTFLATHQEFVQAVDCKATKLQSSLVITITWRECERERAHTPVHSSDANKQNNEMQ